MTDDAMTSCSQCEHYDSWHGEEICTIVDKGLANGDQDHWMVRKAWREDNPAICPMKKRRLQ